MRVNENITPLILRHDKDIITLIDKVNSLKLVIQSLPVQLLNKEDKIESTIENTDQGAEQISGDMIAPETHGKFAICEY